jgi:hypothetical protein
MLFTADSAKQFLLSKLADRAHRDGIPLDKIERRMFLFSEIGGTPDLEAQEIFDRDYNNADYESKITKLLRSAYAHDRRMPGSKDEWKAALHALRNEDFYGLVMVDLARIPRAVDLARIPGTKMALWNFLLGMLPFAATELGIVVVGFFVIFQPGDSDCICQSGFACFYCLSCTGAFGMSVRGLGRPQS